MLINSNQHIIILKNAELKVGPYLKAGKVRTFEYGGELFPGITPVASPDTVQSMYGRLLIIVLMELVNNLSIICLSV